MLNCLNWDLNSDNLTVEVSVCIPLTGAAGAGIDYRKILSL
jgi:hypothetical protein